MEQISTNYTYAMEQIQLNYTYAMKHFRIFTALKQENYV